MLLYLHGTVLNWFEPTLTSVQHAAWLSDYSMFISELQNNFGPHDPEGEAEAGLKNLRMCENQQITKYLVEFNGLAVCIQWGDAPLWHHVTLYVTPYQNSDFISPHQFPKAQP